MSEHEEEVAPPNEEQLQAAREGTPVREEDQVEVPEPEPTPALTPETSEEVLTSTPKRVEDDLGPQEAVEETAEPTAEESEHEAVSPEGQGADNEDHDSR